ncbi:protein RIK isoform X2 [Telopea speciosissima]|uniref:protein RIK isoform X2 n=1 Tax=Telopea speciosissima TaxID=54955 RepID=UPI001CC344D5|nr:protein RIK isoform X2 [Telopea speciosissima]
MTEDSCLKASEESMAAAAAATRQRKKRKWDQPAESLISAGLQVPGLFPLGNVGSLVGMALPGITTPSGTLLTNPLPTCATVPHTFQALSIPLNTSAVLQKLNQPKIQDELIAREIVINDAETSVRYKLTKRQTQEEIQKCTGAVVITRGKYRPPNALPDGEKPLYLHISAGAHLKDTAERIKAVDHAAAMVEEMLKQGINMQPATAPFHSVTNTGQVTQPLSTCVFLGFDADPTLNIAARIHGPNDQYINHIMNETGATVVLRGRGSGNFESPNGQELAQPLHLCLSCNNLKSLDDAKHLAENLLDTISAECGVSRVTSSKVYNAVPPPQQLLAGVESSGSEQKQNLGPIGSLTSSAVGSTPIPHVSSITVPGVSGVYPQVTAVSQPWGLPSYGQLQSNMVCYPLPAVIGGTRYSGYEGIYPQATPLQQVALALRQSPSPVTSATAPVVSEGSTSTLPKVNQSSNSKEKRPVQRRKFQELPVASQGPDKPLKNSLQGPEFLKPGTLPEDLGVRDISAMPPPQKLIQASSNGMLPPPPRTMPPPPSPPPPKFTSSRTMPPPPPPPPKFTSSTSTPKANGMKLKSDPVPDTLIKLMEYGEEDDEPDGTTEDFSKSNSTPKPFWAV